MSDDSDQEYVYSEDEDDYNDDEDAEMSDADAPRPAGAEVREHGSATTARPRSATALHAHGAGGRRAHVPPESAEVLLRHVGWSAERLMEAFWSDGERLTGAAGVDTWAADGGDAAPPPRCRRRGHGHVPHLLRRRARVERPERPCGHFFCEDCYGGYLANAATGASCVMATRPSGLRDDLRWCPARAAAAARWRGSGSRAAGCGCNFCMRCGEEAHSPASCGLIAQWTEKCQNESETANWILANTKRCPKCQTRIEKNQGCNHMNCSQCKYEFCWMCMGDWADHGATTGGFYKCNKYDPQGRGRRRRHGRPGAREARARPLPPLLQALPRPRPVPGLRDEAARVDGEAHGRAPGVDDGSWIDVQFLKTANEMVIDCRRVLKNTYVFGYYLPTPARQRELFENLQEHLALHGDALRDDGAALDQMDRSEIVNVTRVTESFLANLIQGAEAGLDVPDDDAAPAAAAAA
ncbi:hypothetical protein JL720_12755 [Aureococcus anophagefferens]|nr:hypothetical protein JL720_12755 [Aureococcus anophagefferens]